VEWKTSLVAGTKEGFALNDVRDFSFSEAPFVLVIRGLLTKGKLIFYPKRVLTPIDFFRFPTRNMFCGERT
jgi:hypothetical protein